MAQKIGTGKDQSESLHHHLSKQTFTFGGVTYPPVLRYRDHPERKNRELVGFEHDADGNRLYALPAGRKATSQQIVKGEV